jgi:hypothetical protein
MRADPAMIAAVDLDAAGAAELAPIAAIAPRGGACGHHARRPSWRLGAAVDLDTEFEPAIRWTGYDHPYLLTGYAPQDNGRSPVAHWRYRSDTAASPAPRPAAPRDARLHRIAGPGRSLPSRRSGELRPSWTEPPRAATASVTVRHRRPDPRSPRLNIRSMI